VTKINDDSRSPVDVMSHRRELPARLSVMH